METRTLRIWDGKINGGRLSVAQLPRIEHVGPYVETYEDLAVVIKANFPERQEFRIGRIFRTVKNSVAVFKQTVTSRDDYIPTDIVMGPDVDVDRTKLEVLAAWSTDPQHADPPGQDALCIVTECDKRVPNEKENELLADARSRENPPTEADRQRWCEKEKANQRRAKAEEAMIRLAEKAYADTPAKAADKKTSKALSEKRAKAAKGNRTVKDKYDRAVIKAAVLRKIKQGYTSNQAHNEVAGRCKDNQNLLKLKEGPYSFISARSVGRIAMNK